MRWCLLIIFTLLNTCLCAQSSKDTLEYYLDYFWRKCEPEQAHYYRKIYKEENGGWHAKDYYLEERSLQSEGVYAEKELKTAIGMQFWYHPNRMLARKGRYVEGVADGLWREYNSKGKLTDSTFYKNGGLYHCSYKWHCNGQLKKLGVYNAAENEGYETYYYPDGTVNCKGKIINGCGEDSIWTFYYENGAIASLVYFKDGAETKTECFDESGQSVKCKQNNKYAPSGNTVNWKMREIADYIRRSHFSDIVMADIGIRICIDKNGKSSGKIVHKLNPKIDSVVMLAIKEGITGDGVPVYYFNRPVKYCIDFLITLQTTYNGLEVIELRNDFDCIEGINCDCE